MLGRKIQVETIETSQQSYSSDPAPSCFCLFCPMKNNSEKTCFSIKEKVMNAEYFDGKYAAYFRDSIFALFHCQEKCIYSNDDQCGKICLIYRIKILK